MVAKKKLHNPPKYLYTSFEVRASSFYFLFYYMNDALVIPSAPYIIVQRRTVHVIIFNQIALFFKIFSIIALFLGLAPT